MDWPYSLRGAVVTFQVNFHETQADGLVMARRSASFRLALVFRGSCTSYLKIVLFSEHHFERSQNLATYRKNIFNEAHEVVICSNFFQFLPSVRSHGILAKIHGKFLGSLAKILP